MVPCFSNINLIVTKKNIFKLAGLFGFDSKCKFKGRELSPWFSKPVSKGIYLTVVKITVNKQGPIAPKKIFACCI